MEKETVKTSVLTLEDLKEMKPYTVFAHGYTENSPDGVYMTNSNIGRKMLWIAKRGGIHDWAIYIHWADRDIEWVKDHGDKVTSAPNIRRLVPCDDKAFEMYIF